MRKWQTPAKTGRRQSVLVHTQALENCASHIIQFAMAESFRYLEWSRSLFSWLRPRLGECSASRQKHNSS
jgi:hypothetical protein